MPETGTLPASDTGVAAAALGAAGPTWVGVTWGDGVVSHGTATEQAPWLPVGVTYTAIPVGALATALFVLERMAFGSQAARAVVRIGDGD